jgi:prefoldin alpha subunit
LAAVSREEDELRKLSMQLRYFEQTAENLQQRLGMLNAALTDLQYAIATLDGIETEKENSDMLVPIGGGNYVTVKLANANKVIVGLGAGVNIEKTVPEAKTILKGRTDDLEKTREQAQQQLTQIAERITQDRNKMETLLSTVKQGPQ